MNTTRNPYIIIDARTIAFTGIELFYDIIGRELNRIIVERDFGYKLKKAFSKVSEISIARAQDIEETVGVLDGIIGWLTMYGYYAVKSNHREALKKTIMEGSRLMLQEIENFLGLRRQAKRRYTYILKLLSEPAHGAR